jgi:ABC-type lipopolysaccharide export system ATPase subunit
MMTLEFDGIEKSFLERKILSSIYMRCDTGSVIALLGRNGAGKSTLMQIVFGSLSADSQSIRLNRCPLLNAGSLMKHIGYLPQQRMLPFGIPVKRALRDFGIEADVLIDSFPEFMNWMNFEANQLSGGWLRILETFLILKSKKSFVLLDEPFSGLMPIYVAHVRALIEGEKMNKGIIISDHLYQHTLDIADKIYLVKDGKTYLIEDSNELIFRGYLTTQSLR